MPSSSYSTWSPGFTWSGGTIGAPEDPALAALFLASDSARWLTGVTLDVAGGRIMM